MVTKDIPINHKLLSWARKEAKLSLDLAAQKAKINAIKKRGTIEAVTPSTRLERWENDDGTPSYSQLLKLAKAYRRPVLTFFLPDAPKKEVQLVDFRTILNRENEINSFVAEFSALVRQCEAIQKSVREILHESHSEPLTYVGSATTSSNPIELAQIIHTTLDCNFTEQRRIRTVQGLFSFIREKSEEKGIYTILQGNLGSSHTNMSPNVFRGFTLSDKFAPFIVINPNDTKTANVFTFVHELCHLWLGDTGVSNWNSLNISEPEPIHNHEQFCDKVSAEFLVPKTNLLKEWDLLTIGYESDIVIKRIARQFKVSPIVIARRLLEFEKISPKAYWNWYEDYQQEWLQIQQKISSKKTDHPSYRIRTRTKLGNKLINTIIDASREGIISELDASLILNVKTNNFNNIL